MGLSCKFPLIQSIEIGAAKKQQHSVMTSDWLRPDLAFRCCKLVHLARPNADLYHGQSMVYDVYGHPIFGTLCYENINPYENGLMTIPNIYIYIIGSKF